MDEPISNLSGVGPKLTELLARLKIQTIGDLVEHYPTRYEDYSQVSPLSSIKPGPVTAKVKVGSVNARYVRRGLHITEAILNDDSGSVKAVWFNQPYRKNQLVKNHEYFVSGIYEFNNRTYSILNPSLEKVSDLPKNTARIVPTYKETKGLKSHSIRKLLAQIDFQKLDMHLEVPYKTQLDAKEAARMLHFPSKMQDIEDARSFFAFEELFALVLAAEMARAENEKFLAASIPFSEAETLHFVKKLGFNLTTDQRKAAWRCLQEVQETRPMNRLLEGDVGSGKTVVAAILAYNTVLAGFQVAFMVPTEVLATQHAKSLQKMFSGTDVKIELYTGSLSVKEKNEAANRFASGHADIVIGTQALIQDGVTYKNLNLAIIDEQHRFGVKQRVALVGKSKKIPHVLTMTATPIPRTLALTVFGDLDISLIKEMPKGRKPVKTTLLSPNSIEQAYRKIKDEVSAGRQAFIVYPLVEQSDVLVAKSAVETYEKLTKRDLKDLKLGLLHGRMKAEEKEAVMKQFSAGEIDVLVSTTVIEVGVDIPNASVMVIEGAERFGLAQIHQLRGRVGRGDHQSYCILVPSTSQAPSSRLRILETVADGFKLAQYDLELRGPGAIYGSTQHGDLDLRFTKLDDVKQIEAAKQIAQDFVKSGEELVKYPRLASQIERYKSITHLN